MKMSTRYLLILCIAAVTGVFVLQFFWLRNYYYVTQADFAKEVNLAFEDAVDREFKLRTDTVEQMVLISLLDTKQYILKNRYSQTQKTMLLSIADAQNLKDSSAFHTDSVLSTFKNTDSRYRNKAARYLAHNIRVELGGHFIFYHTQKLGDYVNKVVVKYDFDTLRLRPVLQKLLAQRNIDIPFRFYVRSKDSTFNQSSFNPTLLASYPVITKAFSTFKRSPNEHYVRAMFTNPQRYIIAKLGYLFAGSLVLILVVAFSLFYLFRSLLTEKKLSAIKNDFISNITHEFKTPIASVSAAVEALSSFNVLDDREKTMRYLTHSKNELKRLSVLVDKVLNSSIYESGAFNIKAEEIMIDDTIKTILQNQALATPKNVQYSYTNSSIVHTLMADKLYFEHAISNVIDNAIKYSGNEVNIQVACTQRLNKLLIAVSDNGIGIAGTNLPMVFEKFYRVPTGKQHQVKGHGLGLSYVKSIAERHGGQCKIDSETGKGTTLTLSWPV
jgi:two-component system phosphate regulon sensor histidine kinase PhoR